MLPTATRMRRKCTAAIRGFMQGREMHIVDAATNSHKNEVSRALRA